jgi:predicted MPP superfamily phosphohydrolase
MRIALFFSLFFLLFGSTGYYLYLRLTQAFSGTFVSSRWFLIVYIFLIISFLIGKIIEHFSIGFLSHALVSLGSITLGFFVYALMIIVAIDFFRLINWIIPFFPGFITSNMQRSAFILGWTSIILVTIIVIKGYINAYSPRVNKVEITINKPKANFDSLNIVAISDIHLGTLVNESKLQRLINTVNALKPDVVIIAGDNIDNNIKVVQQDKLLEHFKDIHSKYGIYSCMGNHEYISGAHHHLDYFAKNAVQMLRDTAVFVGDRFYIIGREDISAVRKTNHKRKDIGQLTENLDFDYPVILLDHQPFKLEETAKYPIDLQFSGHTHNGQLWPFNYLTAKIFEQDWGYLKKKNTHFYISAGFGTALIPMRLGSYSEIVSIRMVNRK